MNISDVKQQIKDKQLQSYYIFAGDEIEIQRIYVNKIAEVSNRNIRRAEALSDIWQDIINPSMFGDAYVYVVRDDKDLMQNEKIQHQIDNGILGNNILIHLLTTVDKRTKYCKNNADKIVVFERLNADMLSKYIRKSITLNKTNCERFIAICENDYSRLLLEIDKIQRYVSQTHISYDEAFEQLVNDGTIYDPPYDAIFDLVDAILRRQVNRVYNLLYQAYGVGEANLVILNVLYTNAKQVLQVQACESSDIASSTGLTKWQVKCAKEKCGNYSIGELVNILKLIQRIQKGIITGQIEDSMSVEYLLVNIL